MPEISLAMAPERYRSYIKLADSLELGGNQSYSIDQDSEAQRALETCQATEGTDCGNLRRYIEAHQLQLALDPPALKPELPLFIEEHYRNAHQLLRRLRVLQQEGTVAEHENAGYFDPQGRLYIFNDASRMHIHEVVMDEVIPGTTAFHTHPTMAGQLRYDPAMNDIQVNLSNLPSPNDLIMMLASPGTEYMLTTDQVTYKIRKAENCPPFLKVLLDYEDFLHAEPMAAMVMDQPSLMLFFLLYTTKHLDPKSPLAYNHTNFFTLASLLGLEVEVYGRSGKRLSEAQYLKRFESVTPAPEEQKHAAEEAQALQMILDQWG